MFSAFSVLVGLGATLGLAWVAWRTQYVERMPLRQVDYRVNAGLFSLIGALIGGRAAYVWVNWGYFETHANEVVQVWLGGLSWSGALLVAIAAMVGYAAFAQISLGSLADALLPLALMVSLGSWFGCLSASCAYGPPAPADAWWALPVPDEWGQVIPRFPLQLLGAFTGLASFSLIEWLRPRLARVGQSASLGLLALSAQMAGLSFLRADPAPLYRNQRLDSWAGIFFLALALVICLLTFFPRPRREPEPERISQPADSV